MQLHHHRGRYFENDVIGADVTVDVICADVTIDVFFVVACVVRSTHIFLLRVFYTASIKARMQCVQPARVCVHGMTVL